MSEIVRPELLNVNISEAPLRPEALLQRVQEVGNLYRAARTVFPWHETDVSLDEACEYITSLTQHEGFGAFIAESTEGQIVGARLHELITIDRLEDERGPTLREFVQTLTALNNETPLVWIRETFILPHYQRQGLATRLGNIALTYIADQYSGGIALCRVRRGIAAGEQPVEVRSIGFRNIRRSALL